MDSSVVATALVTIGEAFEDFEKLQWVVLAYLLTYLGMILRFAWHTLILLMTFQDSHSSSLASAM